MTVGAVSFLVLVASVVFASTNHDFDHRYPSCFLDRLEYCKNIQGLAATFQCLDTKLDQLSPGCRASLEKSPAFQCSFDAMLLCPRVDNHFDIMSCLWSHRDGPLSSRCAGSGTPQPEWELGGKFHECSQDKKKFCSGLHGFPRVMSCLTDHQNDLSEECKTAVGECPAFKCAHDAERLCPHAKSHHDFLKCIWAHKSELSDECKQVISPPPSSWLRHENDGHYGRYHYQHCHCKHHGKHHRHHEKHHKKHHGHHKEHHMRHHEHCKKHRGHHHEHEHGRHRRACKFDVRRFCYDADGFVNKMACLANHEDSLSDSCHMVLKHCPAFYCANDVQKFCPGTKSKHDFIKCLWEHRHELTDKCMNQDHNRDRHTRSNDKCQHEREKYCPEEQKKSPQHDIECLGHQQQSRLSEQCRKSLHMRLACKEEVEKFCDRDDSYPLKCLKEHEEALDDSCKAALPYYKIMAMSSTISKPATTNRPSILGLAGIFLTFFMIMMFATLIYHKREDREQGQNQYQRI